MRKRYQICFVKKRLRQADTNTIISQKNAWKEINGFSKNKNRQWETIWWRVSQQRIKARTEARMSSFIPDSKKRKTQPQTFSIPWTSSLLKTKVVDIKISKITFSLENSILFELTKFAKMVSNIHCEKTTQTGRHQHHNFTIKCIK